MELPGVQGDSDEQWRKEEGHLGIHGVAAIKVGRENILKPTSFLSVNVGRAEYGIQASRKQVKQKARLTLYELHDNVDWLLLSTDSNEPHNIGVAILLQDSVGGVGEDTAGRGQSQG